MTEAQTPMKEDVAPGKTDFNGTTEPKVLCLGDTYKCTLAGDPGRRRAEPESSGVRRIRRTDLYTDWGALSQNVINLIASAFAIAKLAEHFYDSADSCISRMAI